MEQAEKWVSLDEICEHLGASRDTVKRMIKSQNLPAYTFNRKYKFKISEVDAWMHSENRVSADSDEVEVIDNAKDN